jgi:hypothetical protein
MQAKTKLKVATKLQAITKLEGATNYYNQVVSCNQASSCNITLTYTKIFKPQLVKITTKLLQSQPTRKL